MCGVPLRTKVTLDGPTPSTSSFSPALLKTAEGPRTRRQSTTSRMPDEAFCPTEATTRNFGDSKHNKGKSTALSRSQDISTNTTWTSAVTAAAITTIRVRHQADTTRTSAVTAAVTAAATKNDYSKSRHDRSDDVDHVRNRMPNDTV